MVRASGVKALFAGLLLALLVPAVPCRADVRPPREKIPVAVVELESSGVVGEGGRLVLARQEVQFITDAVRKAATDSLDSRVFSVLTRESIDVLLPPSKVTCLVGKCLAEIGRQLQARFVVGGSVKVVGTKIGVTIELYVSATGALLGSEQIREDNADLVFSSVQAVAPRLMKKMSAAVGASGVVSPEALGSEEQVSAIRAETGGLFVEGTPAGATVDINGPSDFGSAGAMSAALPFRAPEVPAGNYKIKVSQTGYDDFSVEKLVRADRTTPVTVDLVQTYGRMNVTGSPEGTAVRIVCGGAGDTREVGLPSSNLKVRHGRCRVSARRVGWTTFERDFDVKGGETTDVVVNLVEAEDRPAARPIPVRDATPAYTYEAPDLIRHRYVNRGVLLAGGNGETGIRGVVGLDRNAPGRRFGLDLWVAYGVEDVVEFDLGVNALRYYGNPWAQVDQSDYSLVGDSPTGGNFGGVKTNLRVNLLDRVWAMDFGLDIAGVNVSSNKFRLKMGMPLWITLIQDYWALHFQGGIVLGVGGFDGVCQFAFYADYGLAFNPTSWLFVDVTSGMWKWTPPDLPVQIDLRLLIGFALNERWTLTTSFAFTNLKVESRTMAITDSYGDVHATVVAMEAWDARELSLGITYHFGSR